MMVTAASAERLAVMRLSRKQAVMARQQANDIVTTGGRPPRSRHNNIEIPPTELAAIRVRASGRASLAFGDSTSIAEIRHQIISE
jgi:hypothetical protein